MQRLGAVVIEVKLSQVKSRSHCVLTIKQFNIFYENEHLVVRYVLNFLGLERKFSEYFIWNPKVHIRTGYAGDVWLELPSLIPIRFLLHSVGRSRMISYEKLWKKLWKVSKDT